MEKFRGKNEESSELEFDIFRVCDPIASFAEKMERISSRFY
jgi:hypothetical protein